MKKKMINVALIKKKREDVKIAEESRIRSIRKSRMERDHRHLEQEYDRIVATRVIDSVHVDYDPMKSMPTVLAGYKRDEVINIVRRVPEEPVLIHYDVEVQDCRTAQSLKRVCDSVGRKISHFIFDDVMKQLKRY